MVRKLIVLIARAVLLTSCASTSATNPTTPTPPQVTVATSVNLLAQSLDAAVSGLQAAHTAGKISDADFLTAEGVAQVIATTGKSINAELNSTDAWNVQKTKILTIISQAGISAAVSKLPPTAGALLAASVVAYNQIATAVGSPTI